MAHCHTDALATHSLLTLSPVHRKVGGASSCRRVVVTMPTPVLDCGCPAQAGYTITRGTHTPLRVCHHHGDKLKTAAIRQGFIVTEIARVPA